MPPMYAYVPNKTSSNGIGARSLLQQEKYGGVLTCAPETDTVHFGWIINSRACAGLWEALRYASFCSLPIGTTFSSRGLAYKILTFQVPISPSLSSRCASRKAQVSSVSAVCSIGSTEYLHTASLDLIIYNLAMQTQVVWMSLGISALVQFYTLN